MRKSVISSIIVLLLLIGVCVFEWIFIKTEFTDFKESVKEVHTLVESKTATESDMYSLQEKWVEKKKYFHAFIPHNEIKEFDLWIAESIKLVKYEKWEDAISKIEVVLHLAEQVPLTFMLSFENIF